MIRANSKHEFNSALIGMLLGDAYILNNSQNSYYMYLRHGGKQMSFVDEKVNYLYNYIKPKTLETKKDKNGYFYRYAYYNENSLKYLYKNFYIQNGKKVDKYLKSNILNRITPISLAFWYMDDGCLSVPKKKGSVDEYKNSFSIILNTQGFSYQENVKLQALLEKKFGVKFKITKDRKYFRLWCSTKEATKFLEIVSPIVREFPSMRYKLDIKQKINPFLIIT